MRDSLSAARYESHGARPPAPPPRTSGAAGCDAHLKTIPFSMAGRRSAQPRRWHAVGVLLILLSAAPAYSITPPRPGGPGPQRAPTDPTDAMPPVEPAGPAARAGNAAADAPTAPPRIAEPTPYPEPHQRVTWMTNHLAAKISTAAGSRGGIDLRNWLMLHVPDAVSLVVAEQPDHDNVAFEHFAELLITLGIGWQALREVLMRYRDTLRRSHW